MLTIIKKNYIQGQDEKLEQSALYSKIACSDEGSGIYQVYRKSNTEDKVNIDDREFTLSLITDPNHIQHEALDKAGNATVKHF